MSKDNGDRNDLQKQIQYLAPIVFFLNSGARTSDSQADAQPWAVQSVVASKLNEHWWVRLAVLAS